MNKKRLADEQLLDLLKKYFVEKCNGNIARFKMRKAAEFITESGYKFSYETLRKNEVAVEFVKNLKNIDIDEDQRTLAVYKTLDIEAFVKKNDTPEKLIKALTMLDSYYASVVKSAFRFQEDFKKQEEKIKDRNRKIISLENNLKKAETEISSQAEKIKDQKNRIAILENYIDTTVHIGCAKSILKNRGVIFDSDEDDSVNIKVINSDTDIEKLLMKGFD